MTAVISE